MTHEVVCYALDPAHPYTEKKGQPVHRLDPGNWGYQFKSESDEKAEERIAGYVKGIEEGKLIPDTDFRQMWDTLFSDGITLVKT